MIKQLIKKTTRDVLNLFSNSWRKISEVQFRKFGKRWLKNEDVRKMRLKVVRGSEFWVLTRRRDRLGGSAAIGREGNQLRLARAPGERGKRRGKGLIKEGGRGTTAKNWQETPLLSNSLRDEIEKYYYVEGKAEISCDNQIGIEKRSFAESRRIWKLHLLIHVDAYKQNCDKNKENTENRQHRKHKSTEKRTAGYAQCFEDDYCDVIWGVSTTCQLSRAPLLLTTWSPFEFQYCPKAVSSS